MEGAILSFSCGTIGKNGEVGNNDKGGGFIARGEFERAMAIADYAETYSRMRETGLRRLARGVTCRPRSNRH